MSTSEEAGASPSMSTRILQVRRELEIVLQDRMELRYREFYDRITRRALEVYDLSVKNNVPEIRAAADACIWFGREEMARLGY